MKMDKLKYITMALLCSLFTACMDGEYDEGAQSNDAPYGNNDIEETNLLTIQELKTKYAKYIATDYRDGVSYAKVDKNAQIKGYVTGNDITGNLYNEVVIQDNTGAIIIAVQQGGICGYLPVGAEVLIELNGLYVGNYAKQAEIGVPYTNNRGQTYVSRMSRMQWEKHFRITGRTKILEPTLFSDGGTKTTWNLDKDDARLGVIKNVSFRNITKKSMWADPDGKQSVSWYFKEYSGNTVMVYTSPYCDFAARTLPQGKVNITGIVKRFNNSWEFVVRSLDDVEELE